MRYFLVTIGLLFSFNGNTQSIIEDSIWFEHTNSYRTFKVWIPEDYDTSTTYQTLYCLDAELLFNSVVSSTEIYSSPDISKMPPTIVVGLYFSQRNDDMGIQWEESRLDENGIAFMELIKSALIPKIEAKFSVSNYRSIIGHSNSSTFIQFFLWEDQPVFQGYLSMSEYALKKDTDHFCTLNPSIPIDFVFVSGKNDAEFRYDSGLKHEAILDSCSIDGFTYHHIIMESADHITMIPQGIPLGLEKLYESFASPKQSADSIFAQLNGQSSIDYLDQFISNKAEKYGIKAKYSFEEIDLLFELLVLSKDSLNMHLATERYAVLFNDSSEYFYEAQCLELMGANNMAETSYLKHIEHFPTPGIWSYKRIIWLYMSKLKDQEQALLWCERGYLKLENTDLIDLIVRIGKKNQSYLSKAKRLLKKLMKLAESETQRDYIKNVMDF